MAAQPAAGNKKGTMMVSTAVTVREDVQQWLDNHGIKVSPYGTARLVKAVESDGMSRNSQHGRRIRYESGATVVAPDYDPYPRCGGGLHFAESAASAQRLASCHSPRYLVCDVDVESMVLIDGEKVKARFCHVRFEGNETDFGVFA